MREILFRGKSIGKWAYGSLQCFKGFSIFDDTLKAFVTVDSKTVGQYTGLSDKNGKRIFEGDIVNIEQTEGWGFCGPATYNSPNVVVTWNNCIGGFEPFANYDCDCGVFYDASEVEVIGNIHDNPELLKECDKK